MKEQKKHYIKNNFLENIIRNRREEIRSKYYSPMPIQNVNSYRRNVGVNRINIRELSQLSDRPILMNNPNTRIRKNRYISEDRSYRYMDNTPSIILSKETLNSRNNINYLSNFNYSNYKNERNKKSKKNFVIFSECPKKISDYILKSKSKSKQKVYHLTYLDENDLNLNYEEFLQSKLYKNYNSNRRDNSYRLKNNKKKNFAYKTFSDNDYSLLQKLYKNKNNKIIIKENIYINNNNRNNYSINNIYTNNQNNDQLKVLKIQSVWRGYFFRRYLINSLNLFYSIMKSYSILNKILYSKAKPSFKQFFFILKYKLPKRRNKYQLNPSLVREKYKISRDKPRQILMNENKTNINVYMPGERKNNVSPSSYIYRRKNKSPKSPKYSTKENNDKEISNNSNKSKNYDGFHRINYKYRAKRQINDIIKYILKNCYLLHFPLFLYRMKILQKMNLVELKFNFLYKLIDIKERNRLRQYFHKYRNNIFSNTINKIFINKRKNQLRNGNYNYRNNYNNIKDKKDNDNTKYSSNIREIEDKDKNKYRNSNWEIKDKDNDNDKYRNNNGGLKDKDNNKYSNNIGEMKDNKYRNNNWEIKDKDNNKYRNNNGEIKDKDDNKYRNNNGELKDKDNNKYSNNIGEIKYNKYRNNNGEIKDKDSNIKDTRNINNREEKSDKNNENLNNSNGYLRNSLNKNKSNLNNINNNKDNLNRSLKYKNYSNLRNRNQVNSESDNLGKNNLLNSPQTSSNSNKKANILKKIIINKDNKNKEILNKYFIKWKKISKNAYTNRKINLNEYKNNNSLLNKYKSGILPKKKFIKIKKIKSKFNFSQNKSVRSTKLPANSFLSDNINFRKMRISKMKILDNPNRKNNTWNDLDLKNKKEIEKNENSYFIKKIADITRKISNKNNIFIYFGVWKKRTKDNRK